MIESYTAGLIDGEGTVSLYQRKHKNINFFRSPIVSVASTTYEIMTFLQDNFGGVVSNKKTYQKHHKHSFSWTLRGDSAILFLSRILPYMIEPNKKKRANMLVLEYKLVTQRNGRYTNEQKAAKINFEKRFFE